jgi:hypothetical protein
MAKADSVHSTPPTNTPTTRRRFLSASAGLVAVGASLTLATPPAGASEDPIFGLIEAHRKASAAHDAALVEQNRLEQIGDPEADWITEAPCHAAMDAFHDLIETPPKTLAGLQAWSRYLEEIGNVEAWMFEEEGPTLVRTLAEALEGLAVAS